MTRPTRFCLNCLYWSQMPDGQTYQCCHANSPVFGLPVAPEHGCDVHRFRADDETTGADARALEHSPRQRPASPHHSGPAGLDGPGSVPQAGRSGPITVDQDGARYLHLFDGLCCATCRSWAAEAGDAETARCALTPDLLTYAFELCTSYDPPASLEIEARRGGGREDLLELVRGWAGACCIGRD